MQERLRRLFGRSVWSLQTVSADGTLLFEEGRGGDLWPRHPRAAILRLAHATAKQVCHLTDLYQRGPRSGVPESGRLATGAPQTEIIVNVHNVYDCIIYFNPHKHNSNSIMYVFAIISLDTLKSNILLVTHVNAIIQVFLLKVPIA